MTKYIELPRSRPSLAIADFLQMFLERFDREESY